MRKLVRLFGALFSMSLRRQVAFRSDLAFEVLLAAVGAVASLAGLGVVYTRTDSLGGWHAGQAIALLGTFQVVSGLRSTFVEPNLTWFGTQVRDGRFDAVLLQPAPSVFLASLSSCAPLALAQSAVGLGMVAYGVPYAGIAVSLAQVVLWLVLLAAAAALMWATRVLVASLVFWAFALELDVVYDAVWQFARYPVDIYRRPLRLVLTYVLPVALVATVPAGALTRGGGAVAVPVCAGLAGAACGLASLAWRQGLRRYTSATS